MPPLVSRSSPVPCFRSTVTARRAKSRSLCALAETVVGKNKLQTDTQCSVPRDRRNCVVTAGGKDNLASPQQLAGVRCKTQMPTKELSLLAAHEEGLLAPWAGSHKVSSQVQVSCSMQMSRAGQGSAVSMAIPHLLSLFLPVQALQERPALV